jgi:hypothetical protein
MPSVPMSKPLMALSLLIVKAERSTLLLGMAKRGKHSAATDFSAVDH